MITMSWMSMPPCLPLPRRTCRGEKLCNGEHGILKAAGVYSLVGRWPNDTMIPSLLGSGKVGAQYGVVKLPIKPGNLMSANALSVDQALRKAKSLSRKGKPGDAQELLRAVLERFPGNRRVIEAMQSGRPLTQEEANAALALYRQGRIDEALAATSALAAQNPNVPMLHNLLGAIRSALGQFEAAAADFSRALALKPDLADVHNNLGDALIRLGRHKDAAASFRAALKLKPDYAEALNNLGTALNGLGERDEALKCYREATGMKPGFADAHSNLGLALMSLGRGEEAVASCREAVRLAPGIAQMHNNLGLALDNSGQSGEATANFRKAIELNARFVPAHSNLCETLERMSRLDELREAVAAMRANCPGDDPRTLYRAGQLAFREKDNTAARDYLEAMPDQGLPPAMQEGRLTLLGKICDKLGDFEAAFGYFSTANRLMKTMPAAANCDPARYRAQIAEMVASFGAAEAVEWTEGNESEARPAPVFMIGFPRSGTTLLDTILRSHPDIVAVEEKPMVAGMREMLGATPDPERLAALTSAEIAALRDAYYAELDRHLDAATAPRIVIDKLPLNIINAGLIKRVFPSAKFILSLRHPADCVLSCFMQNFLPNDAMANFLDIEDSAGLYDGVMTLWGEYEKGLRPDVHTVRYEQLVEDMEGVAAGLLDFLGLDWSDNLKNYRETALSRGRINTPSYQQVTEKLYTQAKGRWENYRPQLAPVLPLLEPWAERFGYGK
jgi:tetratricopeptide (TPR) repeat protein